MYSDIKSKFPLMNELKSNVYQMNGCHPGQLLDTVFDILSDYQNVPIVTKVTSN